MLCRVRCNLFLKMVTATVAFLVTCFLMVVVVVTVLVTRCVIATEATAALVTDPEDKIAA